MAELITVPTFNFTQGEVGDLNWEQPISVRYYNGSIELEQCENSILIPDEHFEAFVKEIRKHKKQADLHRKNA